MSGDCPECKYPEPADWCWEHRISGCPFNRPPRHLNVDDLWRHSTDQDDRLAALEKRLAALEKPAGEQRGEVSR